MFLVGNGPQTSCWHPSFHVCWHF
uniref:Uncharacterized protein n=1 Tax=Anguilla anguilla TaxID=7936 RepID=A0A0E9TA79_ANGAN